MFGEAGVPYTIETSLVLVYVLIQLSLPIMWLAMGRSWAFPGEY